MKNISLIICYCVALLLTGSPAVAGISASLTNTQLRATPVPVSGTVETSNALTDTQLRATDVPVNSKPQTSGGLSVYHVIAVGAGSPAVIKGAPGQVYGYTVFNDHTGPVRVAFHNSASVPTAGASVFFTFAVPAGGTGTFYADSGVTFSAGIGITVVDLSINLADSRNDAVPGSSVQVDVFYK